MYIDTDTILFFAPTEQAQGELTKLQLQRWQPLILWGCNVFGEIYTRSAEGGIGNFKRQPWKTRNVLKNWMMTYHSQGPGFPRYDLAFLNVRLCVGLGSTETLTDLQAQCIRVECTGTSGNDD